MLDHIDKFKEGTTIEKMVFMRTAFKQLDDELVKLGTGTTEGHGDLAIARKNLKQSCMHAVKVIALQGEDKRYD